MKLLVTREALAEGNLGGEGLVVVSEVETCYRWKE